MYPEFKAHEKFKFYELSLEEKRKIINKLKEMLKRYKEVLLAIIYGSFLKDYPFRDIDIALYIDQNIDPLGYKFLLEKELSEKIRYPIDVKILNYAPAWFVLEVFRSGRILLDKLGIAEKIYKKSIRRSNKLRRDFSKEFLLKTDLIC